MLIIIKLLQSNRFFSFIKLNADLNSRVYYDFTAQLL